MAKKVSPDRLLNDLTVVRAGATGPAARVALQAALGSDVAAVVEKAARLIGELKIPGLAAELAGAFDRMMSERDSACAAKIAIAKALIDADTGREAEPVYLRGLRYHQREGLVDPAGALRGYCGLGLLGLRHRDAVVELTDLLADPEPAARIAAARGLASTGREEAVLLLRLRIRAGDPSADALSECMTGLLRLDPERSLPLVAEFLDDESGETRDVAALALGESRHPAALGELRRAYSRQHDDETRKTILIAAGLLRGPEATDWLVSVVENGLVNEALTALQALRVHRRDGALAARVRTIVQERKVPALLRELDQHWRE